MSDGRTVVCAMDGSDYSDHAFDWFMKNVHKPNDHVIFVHVPEYHTVVQSPLLMGDPTIAAEAFHQEEKKVKKLLESLGKKMHDHGIGGKVESVKGKPGEMVVKIAKEKHASMIITGVRGVGTIRRTLMGSVSDYIVHHAHMPVLVVHHPDPKHHSHHHHGFHPFGHHHHDHKEK